MALGRSEVARSSPAPLAVLAALLLLPLVLPPRAEAFIYWTRDDGINRANLDGSGVDQLFIPRAERGVVGDLALDDNFIYWTQVRSENGIGTIGRAKLDGTDIDSGLISGIDGLSSVAVDAEHMYWTHYRCVSPPTCTGGVGRANLDGSGVDPTFIDGYSGPGVAVDANFVYWTNSAYGAPNDTIGRANLDGSGVDDEFINVPPWMGTQPSLMDVAVDANHVYLISSAAPGSSTGGPDRAIARANLDGSGIDPDFIPETRARGIALDAEHIYWTWHARFADAVARANLDGSAVSGTPLDFLFIADASATAHAVAVDGLLDTAVAAKARASRVQKQRGKCVRVKVKVKANEPLAAEASGKIEVNPSYALRSKRVEVVESPATATQIQTETLKLKPEKKAAKKITRALKRGEKATAKLTLKLTDAAGNSDTEKLRVRLKRA